MTAEKNTQLFSPQVPFTQSSLVGRVNTTEEVHLPLCNQADSASSLPASMPTGETDRGRLLLILPLRFRPNLTKSLFIRRGDAVPQGPSEQAIGSTARRGLVKLGFRHRFRRWRATGRLLSACKDKEVQQDQHQMFIHKYWQLRLPDIDRPHSHPPPSICLINIRSDPEKKH
ncbi:hypothetical protein PGT21_035105 [Puccinia graminis f. sp. tritici]|uniref:Uncharacterized protein n=1 Tax=Puccinia graminis f. sp. tritici TaxID=56615 RepID=A0A5B0MR33_PUCGR|nr:hypothetical protein PGT21_035105 [Puccinia graminis f. sp. tritici]